LMFLADIALSTCGRASVPPSFNRNSIVIKKRKLNDVKKFHSRRLDKSEQHQPVDTSKSKRVKRKLKQGNGVEKQSDTNRIIRVPADCGKWNQSHTVDSAVRKVVFEIAKRTPNQWVSYSDANVKKEILSVLQREMNFKPPSRQQLGMALDVSRFPEWIRLPAAVTSTGVTNNNCTVLVSRNPRSIMFVSSSSSTTI